MQPNTFDIRYLTSLAFKNLIEKSAEVPVYLADETTDRKNPCAIVTITNSVEEITPGSGIFAQSVEVGLQHKADAQDEVQVAKDLNRLRRTFYVTGGMAGLATALSDAHAYPYFCYGVVPQSDGPVTVDDTHRTRTQTLAFLVHAMPRDNT